MTPALNDSFLAFCSLYRWKQSRNNGYPFSTQNIETHFLNWSNPNNARICHLLAYLIFILTRYETLRNICSDIYHMLPTDCSQWFFLGLTFTVWYKPLRSSSLSVGLISGCGRMSCAFAPCHIKAYNVDIDTSVHCWVTLSILYGTVKCLIYFDWELPSG